MGGCAVQLFRNLKRSVREALEDLGEEPGRKPMQRINAFLAFVANCMLANQREMFNLMKSNTLLELHTHRNHLKKKEPHDVNGVNRLNQRQSSGKLPSRIYIFFCVCSFESLWIVSLYFSFIFIFQPETFEPGGLRLILRNKVFLAPCKVAQKCKTNKPRTKVTS